MTMFEIYPLKPKMQKLSIITLVSYKLDEKEFYEYSDGDRALFAKLGLKEEDLGRYRGVREEYHHGLNGNFIVVETRDGIYNFNSNNLCWSKSMLNHPMFSHLSTYIDESYLDYWFLIDSLVVQS